MNQYENHYVKQLQATNAKTLARACTALTHLMALTLKCSVTICRFNKENR